MIRCRQRSNYLLHVSVIAFSWSSVPLAAAGDESAYPELPSPYRLHLPTEEHKVSLQREYKLNDRFRITSNTESFAEQYRSSTAVAKKPFAKEIEWAAREAGLDPTLVHALIHVESRHKHKAVSPKGAVGLMQVLPDTALRYGVRNAGNSVRDNLRAGTYYLRDLMSQFDSQLHLVLAAYNAGEAAVTRYSNRIPPYPETQAYVPAVMMQYLEWRTEHSADRSPQRREYQYLPGTRLLPIVSIDP
jgi:soluble lytic murein transglycosylase-like protein